MGGKYVYFSSDGTNFAPVFTGSDNVKMLSVWGTGPNNVYAAGRGDNGFTIFHYDGTTWTSTPLNGAGTEYGDVWGTGPQDVRALNIAPYRTTDGTNWSQVGGLPLAGGAHCLWGTAADNLFLLGFQYLDNTGYIARSTDGTTWTPVYGPTGTFLSDLWGSGANDLYAAGLAFPSRGGVLLHSTDGATWTAAPGAPSAADLAGLWGTSASDIYLVGGYSRLTYWPPSNGTIQHFDGTSWTQVYSNATGHGLADVCGLGAGGPVYCVGGTSSEGIILKGSGVDWTPVFTAPVPLRGVWGCLN